MECQYEPELTPDDLKALCEREESSVSRISDPQDGAILFKPEAALRVDVADGLRPPLIGRALGGEIYGCPGCKK